jgi:hypothetical protein
MGWTGYLKFLVVISSSSRATILGEQTKSRDAGSGDSDKHHAAHQFQLETFTLSKQATLGYTRFRYPGYPNSYTSQPASQPADLTFQTLMVT